MHTLKKMKAVRMVICVCVIMFGVSDDLHVCVAVII